MATLLDSQNLRFQKQCLYSLICIHRATITRDERKVLCNLGVERHIDSRMRRMKNFCVQRLGTIFFHQHMGRHVRWTLLGYFLVYFQSMIHREHSEQMDGEYLRIAVEKAFTVHGVNIHYGISRLINWSYTMGKRSRQITDGMQRGHPRWSMELHNRSHYVSHDRSPKITADH
jgi:hypothetical protein